MNDLTTQLSNAPVASAPAAGGALARTDQQRAIAEVQAAMMVARASPRDPIAALTRIKASCQRPKLAESAVYTYARGGTDISGPSIRLAEAIAQQWGNLQYGIRELEQKGGESTVQAYCWDVETNTRREMTFQVSHIRHTRKGQQRLEDPRDIYELVANQGARRLRACILAIVPADIVEEAVIECESTLKATADTSPEAMKRMLAAFSEYGVTQHQIEKRIQRDITAITPANVVALKKVYASIRDGMMNPADAFPQDESEAPAAQDAVGHKVRAAIEQKRAGNAPKSAGGKTGTTPTPATDPNGGSPSDDFIADMERAEGKK